MDEEKVILHPKMKEKMLNEIEIYMENLDFDQALPLLTKLITHKHQSIEIYRDTLICLIECKHLDEAIDLCEDLLSSSSAPGYYGYLDYYLMALFEAGKYSKLIEVVKEEVNQPVSENYKMRLIELKEMAYHMKQEEMMAMKDNLVNAMRDTNVEKQYILLQQWYQDEMGMIEEFFQWLREPGIHPVIKTTLFVILQFNQIDQKVEIVKLNQSKKFNPIKTENMIEQPFYQEVIKHIEVIEQDNPSLYQLTINLFEQYAFTLYPFKVEETVKEIADSMISIAEYNIGLVEDLELTDIIKKVMFNIELYEEVVY